MFHSVDAHTLVQSKYAMNFILKLIPAIIAGCVLRMNGTSKVARLPLTRARATEIIREIVCPGNPGR